MSCDLRLLFWRWAAGNRRLVLGYHLVAEKPPPHACGLFPIKTPASFEQDLTFLACHYRFAKYPEGLREARGRVLITFDDGYRECYDVVRPLLLRHGVPAIFFVTTGWCGNRRMFYRHKVALCLDKIRSLSAEEWLASSAFFDRFLGAAAHSRDAVQTWLLGLGRRDEPKINEVCEAFGVDWRRYLETLRPYLDEAQVRALARDGFVIGAHGVDHLSAAEADDDALEAEIVNSCRVVRTWTGQDIVPFSFPHQWVELSDERLGRLLDAHPYIQGLFGRARSTRTAVRLVSRIWADETARADERGSLRELAVRHYRKTAKAALRRRMPRGVWEGVRGAWTRVRHWGWGRRCPVCDSKLRRFLPFGLVRREEALCPVCHSLERHRLIWLYLERRTNLFDGAQKRLLHLAPEPGLARRLRSLPHVEYLSADLKMGRAMRHVDVTALPFRDGAFDVILSSHVLQHVVDDGRAMAELFRVLKPGGWALFCERIEGEATREEVWAVTPETRRFAYGDSTYRRLYGRDFGQRLARAGFEVAEARFREEFPPEQVRFFGLGEEGPLFFCRKPGSAA